MLQYGAVKFKKPSYMQPKIILQKHLLESQLISSQFKFTIIFQVFLF